MLYLLCGQYSVMFLWIYDSSNGIFFKFYISVLYVCILFEKLKLLETQILCLEIEQFYSFSA